MTKSNHNAARVAAAIVTVGDQRIGQMIVNALEADAPEFAEPGQREAYLYNLPDDALAAILERYVQEHGQ